MLSQLALQVADEEDNSQAWHIPWCLLFHLYSKPISLARTNESKHLTTRKDRIFIPQQNILHSLKYSTATCMHESHTQTYTHPALKCSISFFCIPLSFFWQCERKLDKPKTWFNNSNSETKHKTKQKTKNQARFSLLKTTESSQYIDLCVAHMAKNRKDRDRDSERERERETHTQWEGGGGGEGGKWQR